jgi:hypothetical protein
MTLLRAALPLAIALLVAGCGGSGGPINSSPSPAPSQTLSGEISRPQGSGTFANDAAASELSFDLSTSKTVTAAVSGGQLQISYDGTGNRYSVTLAAQTDTFTPADIDTNEFGIVRYKRIVDGSPTYLTLVTTPYTGSVPNKYVGMGYLQRNALSANWQETQFSIFTYGFATSAASMPRAGSAGYKIDIFGLSAFPGYEPAVLQGPGTFSVDFASGDFSAQGYLQESGLVTGGAGIGGNIALEARGSLTANDSSFGGNVRFGTTNGEIVGSLAGRFYGVQAAELGAEFHGSNSSGAVLNGAFTGQKDTAASATNLTLTNLTSSQSFYAPTVDLQLRTGGVDGLEVRAFELNGGLNRTSASSFVFGPGNSGFPYAEFTSADQVASSDPNYLAYRKTIDGQDVSVDLYVPGPTNTQLALTYASFGRWHSTQQTGVIEAHNVFFAYGLETPARLLSARTGTARYNGTVIGAGANQDTGGIYDLTGNSQFAIDFSSQIISGALALQGQGRNGTASLDFGSYDLSGPLSSYVQTETGLTHLGADVGTIRTRFYGPDGEEIGGVFSMKAPPGSIGAGTTLVGATVAKRQ